MPTFGKTTKDTRITVRVDDEMKQHLQKHATEGNESLYVRELIRKDMKEKQEASPS